MTVKRNEKPRGYNQFGTARLNGRFTSKEQQKSLGLVPGTVDKPNSYIVKPVDDTSFTSAYENAFLHPDKIQKIGGKIEDGLDSDDEKTSVGTAISRSNDLTRVYLAKTKDRKPQSTSVMSTQEILEHASNPTKWLGKIWYLDRPPCGLQEKIAITQGNMLVLAARQIFGKTTMIALSKVAHRIIFNPGTRVLVATNLEDSAKNFMRHVKDGVKKYGDLCGFITITKDNEKELELSNGSVVKALSSGSTAPRGFTAHVLILDEAAYIDDKRYYEELFPTTASIENPVIIASSTPNGKQGWFYKYWQETNWKRLLAIDTDCTWKPLEWFDETRAKMTDTAYRQEFKCEFLDIENAVFPLDQIERALTESEVWDL